MTRGVVVTMVGLLAGTAHADQVRLVGGSSIEGKASRRGDKVVVEVESGEIALSVDDVERIDAGTSVVQRFDAMRAKVGDRDVKGLLSLANFCRDNDMRDREHKLLVRVVELLPDHNEARTRLGFVRSEGGWVKRDELLRREGFVQYDGRWIAPVQRADGAPQLANAKPASQRARKPAAEKPAEGRGEDVTVQGARVDEGALAAGSDPFVHVR